MKHVTSDVFEWYVTVFYISLVLDQLILSHNMQATWKLMLYITAYLDGMVQQVTNNNSKERVSQYFGLFIEDKLSLLLLTVIITSLKEQ